MFKRILVPVDGGTTSNLGIDAAVQLAKANRAQLRLVHVVDELVAVSTPEAAAIVGDAMNQLRDAGKSVVARALARIKQAGLKAETALVESVGGRPADFVVRDAKKWKADIIVIGTHGRSGLERMFMGSAAEEILRATTIPLLLVRAPLKVSRPGAKSSASSKSSTKSAKKSSTKSSR
jgi:nucleotide-binding universal stress UspA family protein